MQLFNYVFPIPIFNLIIIPIFNLILFLLFNYVFIYTVSIIQLCIPPYVSF